MFDAIAGMRPDHIIDGIILSIVFGFAAGNYACSLVFRLPRGRLILDQKPYCGTCSAPLQVKDLFPVISAMLLKHKCRYCGAPFPVSHTWTEILVGLLFVLSFFKFGFGQEYFLTVFIGVFLVTQAAIQANEKMVLRSVLICTLVSGMLFRTLQDQTIFNFFQGGLTAMIVGCIIWRKQIRPAGHIYLPPDVVFMIVVGAVCVGHSALVWYGLLMALFYVADKTVRMVLGAKNPPLSSVAIGLATITLVLYPELGSLLLQH